MAKDQNEQNRIKHEEHKNHWERDKKSEGTWLSKNDYEKKTGQPGRK